MKRYQIYSAGMRVHPGKDIEYAKGEWVSYEDVEKRDALVMEPLKDALIVIEKWWQDASIGLLEEHIERALRAMDGRE